jgi:hypothetical protein
MHTIEIPDAKIKRYIPSDLSECDAAVDMCELIFHFQNDTINYDEFRTHAIYKLLRMKPLKSGRQKKSLLLFTNFRVNR